MDLYLCSILSEVFNCLNKVVVLRTQRLALESKCSAAFLMQSEICLPLVYAGCGKYFLSVTVCAYGIFAVHIPHMESQYCEDICITFIGNKCSK